MKLKDCIKKRLPIRPNDESKIQEHHDEWKRQREMALEAIKRWREHFTRNWSRPAKLVFTGKWSK